MGSAVPDTYLGAQWSDYAGRRGLVDHALRLARISLPVSYHAGGGVPAEMGSRVIRDVLCCSRRTL